MSDTLHFTKEQADAFLSSGYPMVKNLAADWLALHARVAALEANSYPHMCRDEHEQIGHRDSEHEMCPVCRALGRVTRLAEALRQVEWHDGICPWCRETPYSNHWKRSGISETCSVGHASDCPRQAALAGEEPR